MADLRGLAECGFWLFCHGNTTIFINTAGSFSGSGARRGGVNDNCMVQDGVRDPTSDFATII